MCVCVFGGSGCVIGDCRGCRVERSRGICGDERCRVLEEECNENDEEE